jgi:hypothetical protein
MQMRTAKKTSCCSACDVGKLKTPEKGILPPQFFDNQGVRQGD